MTYPDEVAVFWDYENCPVLTNVSGYAIVNNIRSIAQTFGSIKLFKAYLEVSDQVSMPRALALHSELQSSGVSLTDCPHNGRKDVADKMIIVDMLAYAIDNPAPSTIVLVSGDRDFAYALSILRLRRYHVVLITLSNAHRSLRAQASLCFDWVSDVLEPVDETLSHQLTPPRRGKASLSPAHDKFYSDFKGHNTSRYPFQESYEKSASNVESTNYLQEETKHTENSRKLPKHETTHNSLFSGLERSPQSAASTVAPDTSHSGSEHSPRVIHSPLASSYHTCVGDMSLRYFPRATLRGSASLPNLVQHEVASVTTEPIPSNSSMQIPSAESGLRGSSIDTKAQGLPPPVHSDISPSPNAATPVSVSVPSLIPPSPSSNATVSAPTPSSTKAAAPLQSTSVPTTPDKFKVLIQCLKVHKSKGSLRPLRSKVAVEVACKGNTYRQAGVLRFGQYVALAEKAGIVEIGGSESTAWIGLKAPWSDAPLS